jgi:glutaminyl-tRNA synthetase
MSRLVFPNFITETIEADLESGRVQQIVTRFPPEPNGYAHLGHTFACNLNYCLAADYNGIWVLRMDDTNPETEKLEYVKAITDDLEWMGWKTEVKFASDDFEVMFECAVQLIEKGLAYVESVPAEEMAKLRGTVDKAGTPSPFRERSVSENLDLFKRMRRGEFLNGKHLLRAKIDLANPNMKLRDPPLYRIMHLEHYRQGKNWCIYPLYDYAQALNDAINGVTHSLCSLEFIDNKAIYDWILENVQHPALKSRPYQYEFGRRSLEYTIVSKRKLRKLIETNSVLGWDDPRMPTIAAQRRRGITPDAIRAFARGIGVSRTNRTVDIGALEYAVRDDLNTRSPRIMAVLRPLKVILENLDLETPQTLELPYYPPDVINASPDGLVVLPDGQRVPPEAATRAVSLTREIFIEQDDFLEIPTAGFKRLTLGGTVRLRGAGIIKCDKVMKSPSGKILELHCTVLPEGKASGVIHWVSADTAVSFEARLYDRLFTVPNPEQEARVAREVLSHEQEAKQEEDDTDFLTYLNPHSLEILHGKIEPSILEQPANARYQFERNGYFWQDPIDSKPKALVFNRIIGLKDNWSEAIKSEGQKAKGESKKPKEAKAETENIIPQLEIDAELRASLEPMLLTILEANPEKVVAYKSGRHGLLGFFVGETMKSLSGKNPQVIQAILRQLLET